MDLPDTMDPGRAERSGAMTWRTHRSLVHDVHGLSGGN